jgi:hypothetical protein
VFSSARSNGQILGVKPSVYSVTTAKESLDIELETPGKEIGLFRIQ